MVSRLAKLPKNNSFFLFGARGTGKSTLLKSFFSSQKALWIDLLDEESLNRYLISPQSLRQEYEHLNATNRTPWIVIDEVQKAPKLLNVAHQLIESKYKVKFALTGSSARKLKQKGVNLLAGRAWVENLYPLTASELGQDFDLKSALRWGTLPKLLDLPADADKKEYLQAYVSTYIKTEIQEEQWVRNIEPFRKFLPLVAQMNGKPLNYSAIERDVGVSVPTVKSYYEILEDTLLGFHLRGYHKSVRKQQRQAPKFFFFDTGVKRALDRTLSLPLKPQTYDFGYAFEHWLICEIYRLSSYRKTDYEFSYLLTKDDVEIDLIIDRPGQPVALIEIKSTEKVDTKTINSLERISADFNKPDCFILSLDPVPRKVGKVSVLPWHKGLLELGLIED